MALPSDMQTVPVVLLKRDIERIDILRKQQRMSRSEFLRTVIAAAVQPLFLPDCSFEETKTSSKEPITI